MNYSVQKNS